MNCDHDSHSIPLNEIYRWCTRCGALGVTRESVVPGWRIPKEAKHWNTSSCDSKALEIKTEQPGQASPPDRSPTATYF
jgi:hypothetical protein